VAELTTAAEVRALSAPEAGKGWAVRLRGVFIGEADPEGIAFVVQDETQAIYVQGPPEQVAGLVRGDLLEIAGVTDPGGFAPYVVARRVQRVGTAPVPEPLVVSLDELDAGLVDAKWVEIRGIVRSVEPKAQSDVPPPPPGTRYEAPADPSPEGLAPKVKMKLAAGGARVLVQVSGDVDPEDLVDAEVRLRGICFNLHNRNRQFVRPFVQVPRGVEVVVETPAPADPFATEPSPVASLLRFEQLSGRSGHRVHVRGTVVHHQPGVAMWVRDGAHSLKIETTQGLDAPLAPGDEVDVLGFPARGEYSAVLEDAVFRRRDASGPLEPHWLSDAESALQYDADLVALEAVLVETRRFPDRVALTLDWQGRSVAAQLFLPAEIATPAGWLPGGIVRVQGVCGVIIDEGGPLGGLWIPRAFQLLLRSADDLVVVQAPPWWNAERVVWVLAGFLAVAVATVAGVTFASRRRLREQERRRAMAEAEFGAILAERNRMAREIHDTLSQGLGAISVQLELARVHADGLSTPIRNHLATAHKFARAALAEARESIWNMRSQVLEQRDLAAALESILRQMTEGTGVDFSMRVDGDRRRLPPVVENNLLRIGQEAITNATKHAHPSRIDVRLAFEGRAVRLEVRDDGVGFDPDAQRDRESRSFGLVGMRERVELLGGGLSIESAPGRGTSVVATLSV
jgi:signal transduction histidine kinase